MSASDGEMLRLASSVGSLCLRVCFVCALSPKKMQHLASLSSPCPHYICYTRASPLRTPDTTLFQALVRTLRPWLPTRKIFLRFRRPLLGRKRRFFCRLDASECDWLDEAPQAVSCHPTGPVCLAHAYCPAGFCQQRLHHDHSPPRHKNNRHDLGLSRSPHAHAYSYPYRKNTVLLLLLCALATCPHRACSPLPPAMLFFCGSSTAETCKCFRRTVARYLT